MRFGSLPVPASADTPPPSFAAWPSAPVQQVRRRAFTLIEMMVVIAILLIMLVLIAPAFTQMSAARAINKASYDIAGLLEEARAYAKANNTYTWVGFYEEAADKTAGTAGIGRVIVSVVASKNGTAMYGSTDTTAPPLTTVPTPAYYNLVPLGGLLKIDNVHLTVLSTQNPVEVVSRGLPDPTDPTNTAKYTYVPDSYQVGDDTAGVGTASSDDFSTRSSVKNGTTFNYPLYASTANTIYTFTKIIQFNPLGDATKIVDTPTQRMEIGLRPTNGIITNTASKNCAAVQVSGISGQVRIFRQ